ncbi:MAG TPA: carboxymuconolactone decarboxylase family protein [Acidimicrobiales bacterium]|jgi:AhpD family alkylhydroperoxidase|nr:carboxymuconolactone decarboxylase family protein [Acidimicrobiales bacterium]
MTTPTPTARMKNPALVLSGAKNGIGAIFGAMHSSGIDPLTLELVHLRVSQINGCSACVDAGVISSRKAGESDDRLLRLPAWRETERFTDAERAALALAEAATRMADRPDPVSQEVFDEAADHFSEAELSAVILMVAITNFFNRINVTIQEPAGADWG